MSSFIECPNCMFGYDIEDEGDFKHCEEYEFQCPKCKTPFFATAEYRLEFTGERMPKINEKVSGREKERGE